MTRQHKIPTGMVSEEAKQGVRGFILDSVKKAPMHGVSGAYLHSVSGSNELPLTLYVEILSKKT